MKKQILDDFEIIIDRCPKCKGVFLNKGELKEIINELESEASSSGVGSFAMGMALGNIMSN